MHPSPGIPQSRQPPPWLSPGRGQLYPPPGDAHSLGMPPPPRRDPGTALMAALPHRAGHCVPPQYEC